MRRILILVLFAISACDKRSPSVATAAPAVPPSSAPATAPSSIYLPAEGAPHDKPVHAVTHTQADEMYAAIAPYVAEARRTYPVAKQRYLAGLPKGQQFYITTRLHDSTGREEQVFIAVTSVQNNQITGLISSEISTVSGYHLHEPYTFPESDLIDWLITHPDGSEEGNIVGKFLDNWHATTSGK